MRSLIGRALEARGANPYSSWGDSTPPTNGMLGSPAAGVNVNEKGTLGLASVWACAAILSDAVGTLPILQFRGTGPNKRQVDPAPVLADPYCELTQLDWMEQAQLSLTLRGNQYGRIVARDRLGYPTQIAPVHPDKVAVRRNPTSGEIEYRFENQLIPIEDVYHVRGLMAPGAIVGLNPIEVLRNSFGVAKAADLYSGAFFANSAYPGGILTVPGELDDKQARELARRWLMAHQGIGQSSLPAVLSGGTGWQQISISPADAQFIESKQFSRTEIASIFRIPPHMMGDVDRTTSWGTGIEQQELGFMRNTLLGWLKRHELALTALLPPGQYARFDLSHRLRGDTLQRYQAYMIGRTGGWITSEEIRFLEDMAPLDPEYAEMAANPMAPLNSAQNGSMTMPGTNTDPMAPDVSAQKSPSPGF